MTDPLAHEAFVEAMQEQERIEAEVLHEMQVEAAIDEDFVLWEHEVCS